MDMTDRVKVLRMIIEGYGQHVPAHCDRPRRSSSDPFSLRPRLDTFPSQYD